MITESKCTKHLAKDHTCGFGDILADRRTDRQTDRHTHTQTYSSHYFPTALTGKVSIIKSKIDTWLTKVLSSAVFTVRVLALLLLLLLLIINWLIDWWWRRTVSSSRSSIISRVSVSSRRVSLHQWRVPLLLRCSHLHLRLMTRCCYTRRQQQIKREQCAVVVVCDRQPQLNNSCFVCRDLR